MRIFWLIMEGKKGKLNLNDLPGSGRLDEAARTVNAAFWLSGDIRRDVKLYITFTKLCKTVLFIGSEMRRVYPDERNIGSILIKALSYSSPSWIEAHPGVFVRDIGIEIWKEIEAPIFALVENGEKKRPEENTCLAVGGPKDFPKEFWDAVEVKGKISLGKRSYLASHAVVIANYLMDEG